MFKLCDLVLDALDTIHAYEIKHRYHCNFCRFDKGNMKCMVKNVHNCPGVKMQVNALEYGLWATKPFKETSWPKI
jgi:hypothetical protein